MSEEHSLPDLSEMTHGTNLVDSLGLELSVLYFCELFG
jgi:hypothetical protein